MILLCLVLGAGPVWAGAAFTPEQQRGREIYRRGQIADLAVGVASVGADSMALSSASFACAGCHGIFGEGGREGGIDVPPLSWPRLIAAAQSPLTGRSREGYSRDTLRQAITAGLDPQQQRLHQGMPRFAMPAARLAELIAYLERIGQSEDTDQGVSPTTIRVGTALPLSGPLASAGASIRATLERVFAAAARDGGIYGRRIELVVEDSRGDADGLRDATRHLIEKHNVFALVGSYTSSGNGDTERLLEQFAVPLVGPVTLAPHQAGIPNPAIFYLLPSLYDQARALVDFISEREPSRRPRLAIIHAGNAEDRATVDGLRRQAGARGLKIVAEEPEAASAVMACPDYLIYVGDGVGLKRVAVQWYAEGPARCASPPVLVAFALTAQSGVADLPAWVASRTLLVAPALPPDARQATPFFSMFPDMGVGSTHPGLRIAAYAAGTVFVEALRRTGSLLSRPGLIRTLERLQNFKTDVMHPSTFGPNLRNGNVGAVILAFDRQNQHFEPVSEWVTPKE